MRKEAGRGEQEWNLRVTERGPTTRYDPVSEDDSLTSWRRRIPTDRMPLVAHAMLVMAGSWRKAQQAPQRNQHSTDEPRTPPMALLPVAKNLTTNDALVRDRFWSHEKREFTRKPDKI